jgi:hypothetical protein
MRFLTKNLFCLLGLFFMVFFLGFVPVSWGQQIITTIVGNGAAAYAGDGGPATLASLACPDDIALDSHGNIYIADACSNTVRRVDAATSIITTYAGLYTVLNSGGYSGDGGPATLALLDYPSGIAFDAQDNLYIDDFYNCVIRKVSAATGIITSVVGNGTQGYSGDSGPAANAELDCPTLVRFDNQGNMLISDTGNNVIREVNTATGIITTVVGFWPGNPGYSGDGGPATMALLDGCESMIDDPSGDLYVSDGNNNVVRKVNRTTGVITTVVGSGALGYSGDGGPATLASMNFDNGTLVFDKNSNLFMTDDMNNVIRRVDALTGIITTVAGQGPPVPQGYSGDGGPPLLAQFSHTESLCFDNSCDLLVVDYGNNVIWKISNMLSYCTPSPTSTPLPTPSPAPTATPLAPDIFYVSQNALRPSQGPVSIYVQYPLASGEYNLCIYNSAGEHIKTLDSRSLQAPISQSYAWDGTNKYGAPCASGMYIFYLTEPFDRKMKRILLIR